MKAIARDTFLKLSLSLVFAELQEMRLYVTNTGKVFCTRLAAHRYCEHPGNEATRFKIFTTYDFRNDGFLPVPLPDQPGTPQLKIFS
jgi:hypothetical protein